MTIQDPHNLIINNDYVKDISANNDTLTISKGDNTSFTVTVNNVAKAVNADNATNAEGYLKLTGGTVTGATTFQEHIFLASGIEIW